MPVNGWFPHISVDGRIASGSGEIYVDGVLVDTGYNPKWMDAETLVYDHGGVTRIRNVITSAVTDIAFACNKYAADAGKWQGLQQAAGTTLRLYTGSTMNQEWSGRGGPAIGPTGSWANYDNFFGDTHTVYVNGAAVYTGLVIDVSLDSSKTCVLIATGTYTRKVLVLPDTDSTVESWEAPLIVDGPEGEHWILSVTQTGLILRPVGSLVGYKWTGEYLNPWARWVDDHFVIAASSSAGVLQTEEVVLTDQRYNLQTGQPSDPDTGTGGGGTGGGLPGNTAARTLVSVGTFDVVPAAEEVIALPIEVFPAFPAESGHGRIIHPTLGAFDYEVKPDEWVNIDADAIIPPVWASSRTLTSAANVLWDGHLRDVVVEERWKALGGLAMPITQLRMLLAIWTMPIDPDVGYVHWFPNYITAVGFKVLPINLSAGGQGIALDDVINYKDEYGEPIGWVTSPVTFQLKLVDRL